MTEWKSIFCPKCKRLLVQTQLEAEIWCPRCTYWTAKPLLNDRKTENNITRKTEHISVQIAKQATILGDV